MYLVGNVNIENLLFDSVGVTSPVIVPFHLPQKARSRRKLKLKYFGFHSGPSADNPDLALGDNGKFFFTTGDVKRKYYSWRLPVGEVRMEVIAQGSNITHENVGTKFISESSQIENNSSLIFETSKSCDALEQTAGNIPVENVALKPAPIYRGHSEMSDLTIGFIETYVDQMEIRLTVIPSETDPSDVSTDSFETNVRLDTISFVLELV